MEIKKFQDRKAELMQGLEDLIKKAEEYNSLIQQIKVAIDVQKGAISDCDYWISKAKENEEPVSETEISEEALEVESKN